MYSRYSIEGGVLYKLEMFAMQLTVAPQEGGGDAAPVTSTQWSYLTGVHHLANLAGDAALHAHVNRDDAAAVEYVRDVMHAGRAMDTGPTTINSHMYSRYSIEGGVLYKLEMFAMQLTVAPLEGGGDAAPVTLPNPHPVKRPATRAQVRALIAELLDDQDRVDALRRGFVAERAVEADMAGWFGQNVPLLRPMFELDGLRVLPANDARTRAAEQPDFQAARDVLRNNPAFTAATPQTPIPGSKPATGPAARRRPIDYTRLLTTDVIPAIGGGITRVIDYDMRTRAERRLAAAVLAAQLYRADHAGQVPPTLEALVPKYLPKLPTDPFPAGGPPIRYVVVRGALPGGGDRALVYSTGGDGADDTAARGLAQQLPTVPQFGWQSTSDQWRDVAWFAPQTKADPAAEEAAEKEWREEEARQQAKARGAKSGQ
jgi:hypothetical protein